MDPTTSLLGRRIISFITTSLFTLLTLVPKVSAPTSVTDYRPISCCNVLYKIITKIIVQRMHGVMGKLVSPSQNAFVPDLRKAYDTLEWDLVTASLRLFGFLERMIGWIQECLSTAAYSVSLNSELHGFFKGARELRQGDPMSPYLFVLAMEVLNLLLLQRVEQSEHFQFHWLCKDVDLLSLCFADDLFLFCKADEHSVMLFRDRLQLFVEWSGLQANVSKSQLIVSKSALDIKPQLLAILGFQEGVLPVRYLGWGNMTLSFAARIQLIKSGGAGSGMAKVAWSNVCRLLEEGGQGVRALKPLNKGLMSKHLWDVVQHNNKSIWVTWIYQYRLKRTTVWNEGYAYRMAGPWHPLVCSSTDFHGDRKLLARTELLETVSFYGLPSWRDFPRLTALGGNVRIGLVCSVPEGLLRHMIIYSFNAITPVSACRYFALRCVSPYHFRLGDRTWIGLLGVGGVASPKCSFSCAPCLTSLPYMDGAESTAFLVKDIDPRPNGYVMY
ncbi:UNVERIFIED_CONTAM: hypothetical protein Slati_2720200 [Sesamum latifolium]|uniref:Reverse transcriptase domain-containing protein n=1 Tax=Sesamum latifolium TaxID=2727402 RepID=A0AAW2VXZ1_9LAMI